MKLEAKVPWEFGKTDEELREGDSMPNLPCSLGEEVGVDVAHIADQGRKLLDAKGLTSPKRCDECAFTKGTQPNRSIATLSDVIKCLVESVPFNCHKGENPGTRLCGGWCDAIAHPAFQSQGEPEGRSPLGPGEKKS